MIYLLLEPYDSCDRQYNVITLCLLSATNVNLHGIGDPE